jgi:hypothetical protein
VRNEAASGTMPRILLALTAWYFGVFASYSKWRRKIILKPEVKRALSRQ